MTAPQAPHPFASPQLDQYKDAALKQLNFNLGDFDKTRQQVTEKYVDPAKIYFSEQVESRPITTAVLGLFFACALFPVLGFLLFAISTLTTSMAISLFVSSVIISFAGLVLIGTLVGVACFTGFVAFWAILAWSGFRLVSILLRAPTLPEGLKTFGDEARSTLLPARSVVKTETESI